MRVLQFNLGGSIERLEATLATVVDATPDVLLLQDLPTTQTLLQSGWKVATNAPAADLTTVGARCWQTAVAFHGSLRGQTLAFNTPSRLVAGQCFVTAGKEIAFFATYLRPINELEARRRDIRALLSDPSSMLRECHADAQVVVGGNFNCVLGPWAPGGYWAIGSRHGATTIDLTFSNKDLFEFRTWDWDGRVDHFPLTYLVRSPPPLRSVPLLGIHDVAWEHFDHTLHRHLRANSASPPNPAATWDGVLTALNTTIAECRNHASGAGAASNREDLPPSKPYWFWTPECKAAESLRKRTYDRLRAMKLAVRQAKDKAMEEAVAHLDNAALWERIAILRGKRKTAQTCCPVLIAGDGSRHTSPQAKGVVLAKHFFTSSAPSSQLLDERNRTRQAPTPGHEAPAPPQAMTMATSPEPPPVTSSELRSAMDRLRSNKAPGPDRVSPGLLKQAFNRCNTFQETLLQVVNRCMKGDFPAIWKKATVTAIRKPGDRDPRSPKSYRPISLLCVASKVTESIIRERLAWELTRRGLLRHQYMVLSGISAIHALSKIMQKGKDAIVAKHQAVLITIDVSGAFNKVDHDRLCKTMTGLGLDGLGNWVRGWLSNRQVEIRFEGHTTAVDTNSSRGIPQGSPLSPLLWCLYLDDFLAEVNSQADTDGVRATTGAYMDDLFVLITGETTALVHSRAQAWINTLLEWCAPQRLHLDKPQLLAVSDLQMPSQTGEREGGMEPNNRVGSVDELDETTGAGRGSLTQTLGTFELRLSDEQQLHAAFPATLRPMVARAEKAIYAFVLDVPTSTSFPFASGMAHKLGQERTSTRWKRQALAFHVRLLSHSGHSSVDDARHIQEEELASGQTADLANVQWRSASKIGPLRLLTRLMPLGPVEQMPYPLVSPWEWRRLSVHINDAKRALSSEHLASASPQRYRARVYTDGPRLPASSGRTALLGAAAYLEATRPSHTDQELTAMDGKHLDILDAEIEAICMGLRLCRPDQANITWKRVDIFSDCQDALRRLGGSWSASAKLASRRFQEARDLMAELEASGTQVHFWSVPGHTGVAGNERADRLAKEAALGEAVPAEAYSGTLLSSWIRNRLKEIEEQAWADHPNNSLRRISTTFASSNISRYVGLDARLKWLLLKFRSNTLPVASHRAAVAGTENARCECGADEQTRDHIILYCNITARERRNMQMHLPASTRDDLAAILQGAAFSNETSRSQYLSDLQALLEAGMALLVCTCVARGIFDSAESRGIADLRGMELTFGPDHPLEDPPLFLAISESEEDSVVSAALISDDDNEALDEEEEDRSDQQRSPEPAEGRPRRAHWTPLDVLVDREEPDSELDEDSLHDVVIDVNLFSDDESGSDDVQMIGMRFADERLTQHTRQREITSLSPRSDASALSPRRVSLPLGREEYERSPSGGVHYPEAKVVSSSRHVPTSQSWLSIHEIKPTEFGEKKLQNLHPVPRLCMHDVDPERGF
ncbi:uncharacterized protein UTRI_02288 [Ustilago trichophora]|uniref:Reverse transcriptase n=1 Tax=Ustilago trichophora TaxID=86804 RepID=A0A5C3E5M2_9BASI|nr:uncharacterized protein UTRI_02288 [Ustilago trichophora]